MRGLKDLTELFSLYGRPLRISFRVMSSPSFKRTPIPSRHCSSLLDSRVIFELISKVQVLDGFFYVDCLHSSYPRGRNTIKPPKVDYDYLYFWCLLLMELPNFVRDHSFLEQEKKKKKHGHVRTQISRRKIRSGLTRGSKMVKRTITVSCDS